MVFVYDIHHDIIVFLDRPKPGMGPQLRGILSPNALLHGIEPGDSLWAFTRRSDGKYTMAAELIIRARTRNPETYRYGTYRVWGDLDRSRYFDIEHLPNAEPIIRMLSCKTDAEKLGQSFQGNAAVKRINADDDAMLRSFCIEFPTDARAKLLPEDQLEAALMTDNPDRVRELVRVTYADDVHRDRMQRLQETIATLSRQHVLELRDIYNGCCQICAWSPRAVYGNDICEAHHVQWISRGGIDALSNLVLVCPNHHRAIHRFDAPYDWADNTFQFGASSEALMLQKHALMPVERSV
jgi:5-methylcytosine-specific restriction protein A